MRRQALHSRASIGVTVCALAGMALWLAVRPGQAVTGERTHGAGNHHSTTGSKSNDDSRRARQKPRRASRKGQDENSVGTADLAAAESSREAQTVRAYLAQLAGSSTYSPQQLAAIFQDEITHLEEPSEKERSRIRHRLLAHMARALSASDPAWAREFLGRLPEFHDRLYYSEMVVRTLAGESPEAAISWIEHLDPGVSGHSLVAQLFRTAAASWAKSDLDGARAWAGDHAGHPMASAFVRGLTSVWAEDAPEKLREWLDTRQGDPPAHPTEHQKGR